MADPASLIISIAGPVSTGIAAMLVLTGKLGRLEGKDKVSAAEIRNMRDFDAETRKMINSDADELKALAMELNDLKTKAALHEYIIKETKELMSEVQQRMSSIDKHLAVLDRDSREQTDRKNRGAV
jgi:septal ring factor EnvC (AmiA/AmiB activator)